MELYLRSLKEFKSGLQGYSAIFIIAQSCLGSAAAMFILMNGNGMTQMVQLFFVTIMCMFFNGAVLSQQKPKLILNLLIGSVITSLLLLIANLV
ncbi:hypothetical protein [Spongiimicrobium sp. 3-5]|uniref:hypothetical protein n=1 Tax=Spongiimicrobium sp. 3-5 TaxID=3332596 RepID=UPI00398105BB